MIGGALSFEGLEETEVLIFGVLAGEAYDFAVFEESELLALMALTGGADGRRFLFCGEFLVLSKNRVDLRIR